MEKVEQFLKFMQNFLCFIALFQLYTVAFGQLPSYTAEAYPFNFCTGDCFYLQAYQ
jgi:hypothetical protein